MKTYHQCIISLSISQASMEIHQHMEHWVVQPALRQPLLWKSLSMGPEVVVGVGGRHVGCDGPSQVVQVIPTT